MHKTIQRHLIRKEKNFSLKLSCCYEFVITTRQFIFWFYSRSWFQNIAHLPLKKYGISSCCNFLFLYCQTCVRIGIKFRGILKRGVPRNSTEFRDIPCTDFPVSLFSRRCVIFFTLKSTGVLKVHLILCNYAGNENILLWTC